MLRQWAWLLQALQRQVQLPVRLVSVIRIEVFSFGAQPARARLTTIVLRVSDSGLRTGHSPMFRFPRMTGRDFSHALYRQRESAPRKRVIPRVDRVRRRR